MARCMSPVEPSPTSPMTSSVAGLTLAKVAPDWASTSLPSMSIRDSGSIVCAVTRLSPSGAAARSRR